MKFGVGFIPSYTPDFKSITDIDSFICPLDAIEMINGVEYVKDGKGYMHPLSMFQKIDNLGLPRDTCDARSKVFDSYKEAFKHLKRVEDDFFKYKSEYFKFDEGA